MAPVKKQNVKKPSKTVKEEKDVQNPDQSVVSGQLQKKINKKQLKTPKAPKGVVFIKNLPHGFFEDQLKKYFEQFGNVSRVRLARSKRTGNSKGYAFVEFDYPEVAEVAAETMDNYLMFKHIVKASYIPPEKQQFNYFRTSVKRIRNKSGKLVWVSRKTASIQQKVKKQNDWNDENYQKRTEKQLAKLKKIGEKYAHLGIDVNELVVQPKMMTKMESNELSSIQPIKRKLANKDTVSSKQTEKKLKKKVSLEDLLGNTIPEDSDDDDYAVGNTIEEHSVESGESSDEETVTVSCKQTEKKLKNKVSLEDLLGNTIPEDSDDDDYAVGNTTEEDSVESGESSDEETYGFVKDSESEVEEQDDSENASDEEETVPKPIFMLNKLNIKNSNVDRFDEMLKRTSHAGGVKKTNKKPSKLPHVENKKKAALKMAAAKELAKPLSKVITKLSGPLKSKKSLIKSK